MITFLESLFGSNWRTTFIGWLKAFIIVAVTVPNVLDFLPPETTKIITGVCGLLYAILAITGGIQQKDKKVDY
jgi:hypothetical protein